MSPTSVDTDAIRSEARKWTTVADEMSTVRGNTQNLWLAPTAFFIGNLTEPVHYPAYRDFLDRIVTRLSGAEVEFELIGTAMRRMADAYDENEALTKRSLDELYTVSPDDVADAGSPGGTGRAGGRPR